MVRERYLNISIGTGTITVRRHVSSWHRVIASPSPQSNRFLCAVTLSSTSFQGFINFTTQQRYRYFYIMVQGEFSFQLIIKMSHSKVQQIHKKTPLERLVFVQDEENQRVGSKSSFTKQQYRAWLQQHTSLHWLYIAEFVLRCSLLVYICSVLWFWPLQLRESAMMLFTLD